MELFMGVGNGFWAAKDAGQRRVFPEFIAVELERVLQVCSQCNRHEGDHVQ
jgi:hypothetical protein